MCQNISNFSFHIYEETELDLEIALFGLIISRINSKTKYQTISCALT